MSQIILYEDIAMIKKSLLVAAFIALVGPSSAFAYTGTIVFKAGCRVTDSGSCTLGVSGTSGSVKIYAAPTINGHYGAVSHPFTAPGTKRIANSTNNVCFYARAVDSADRTRKICLHTS